METYDDDLIRFEAEDAAPLPETNDQGYIEHEGARTWYAAYGSGSPVILLHGGLSHSGKWGYQVPALVRSGYHVIVIDSRGHGRSIPNAKFVYLPGVSHFAPLQRHEQFNSAILGFLPKILP